MSPTVHVPTHTIYFINELVRADDGGFIPCIAVENQPGYYKTDWNWGADLAIAQSIADQKNAALGFTPQDAMRIQASTMRLPKPR